jgi:hypothetical protein
MKRILAVTVMALALAGCATSGPTYDEAQATLPKMQANQGRIVIYRSSAFGAAIQPSVSVNGAVVGGSQPMGFYVVDRPPGDYSVAVSTEVEKKLSFTLTSGEERYVRLVPTFGLLVGRIVPELIGRDEALKELKDLRFVGGAAK